MNWTWEKIVELNKVICEASGQPHAVRYKCFAIDDKQELDRDHALSFSYRIAEQHPFIEGNKRTAACLAICLALEGV